MDQIESRILKMIFITLIKRNSIRSNFFNNKLKKSGFSLVEILVALFLMVLMITTFTIGSGGFSPRQKLEETINNLERAIRFSVDEAAIQNTIIRINIDLNSSPQSFYIEKGPDANFVLPKKLTKIQTDEPSKDDQKMNKELKSNFSKVDEFSDGAIEIPDQVSIIGIGTTLGNRFIDQGEASIYFYPTGEKDAAVIILKTDDEIAQIGVEAFTIEFNTLIQPLKAETKYELKKQTKEIFKEWLK